MQNDNEHPESQDASTKGQSRREFLGTAAAATGAVALGAAGGANAAGHAAAKRHPKRGGTLRFGTRADTRGLDPHRNYFYYASHPLAAVCASLVDINQKMEPVPGLAEEWTIADDLKSYTFKLRAGTTFHNGAAIDADAVAWNFARVKDPKIGHPSIRAAIRDVESWDVLDKSTFRINLSQPNASMLANLIYYPFHMMAPGTEAQADTNPICAGPFKFKSWRKNHTTEMERHDGWYETDAEGNQLPYLDALVGKPKKEDRVRLTALRTDEVDLIDAMPYTDAATFAQEYKGKFQAVPVPQLGTALMYFNLKNGPFSSKNPHGKILRQAVAHAMNHEAIHQAVFSAQGQVAKTGYFGPSSPWYTPDAKPWPEYDPDKARFLIKKAGAEGEPILFTSRDAYSYMHGQGEIGSAMLTDIGFKVKHEIHPYSVLKAKWRKGEYHIDATGHSYRMDADGWYSRGIYSKAASTKLRNGFVSEEADKLIEEGKRTGDIKKRLEIYTDLESIVNEELPCLYTVWNQLMGGASLNLKNYQPTFCGPFSHQAGGVRGAWIA